MFRFKPAKIRAGSYPVILCHGLSVNSYFWDIEKKHSFAAYLRSNGYDVWTLFMRGYGRSTKPLLGGGLSKFTVVKSPLDERYTLHPGQLDWNVDDHIDKDIPAAIAYVKAKTGKEKVNLIGHSLGGVIICAYLQKNSGDDINSFVSVGAPFIYLGELNDSLKEILKNKDLFKAGVIVNLQFSAQFGAPLAGSLPLISNLIFANRDNISSNVISIYLSNVLDDVSPGIMNQYMTMLEKRHFLSADGKRDYTAGLGAVKQPVLFIGGSADCIAPTDGQLYAYQNIGSADKTVKIFGKETFSKVDYGHTDIIIGKNAPTEVYPYILNWLNERDKK